MVKVSKAVVALQNKPRALVEKMEREPLILLLIAFFSTGFRSSEEQHAASVRFFAHHTTHSLAYGSVVSFAASTDVCGWL